MPLPLIDLDNRRWSDLVEEGTALVPRYAPRWTDHNVHDPGITLIELFAWLTEMTLYRLNRVPPRHRRKFLALVGFRAAPPRPAHAVLSFDPAAATTAFNLPAGVTFDAVGRDGRTVPFATARDVTIAVVSLAAVQVETGGQMLDRTADWRDGFGVAAFGDDPRPGAAVYFGFNDLPTKLPVALAFRFAGPATDDGERARLVDEAAAQRRACRPILPDFDCDPGGAPPPSSPEPLPPHHSARVVWEVFTGAATPWSPLEPVPMPARPAVGQVVDDTRAHTLDGLVELNLPATAAAVSIGPIATALFYVRCRLVDGDYDAPPILLDVVPNAVAAEQATPASQSFPIRVGVTPTGSPPTPGSGAHLIMQLDATGTISALAFLPPGTVGAPDVVVWSYTPPGAVAGEITLGLVVAGVGTARPLAPLTLTGAPVDGLRVYTQSPTGWQEWTRRDDFEASTRTDLHYVVDATGGTLTFGDGEHGFAPSAGALVVAFYRTTLGDDGNVPAIAVRGPSDMLSNRVLLSSLAAPQRQELVHVTNRAPAIGGAAEETLAETTGRAVETLHAHDRLVDLATAGQSQTLDQIELRDVLAIRSPTNAVNLLDIERLALAVPGTRVARARACAGIHPDYPCLDAAGVVTVVILPEKRVPEAQPSVGLRAAVARYLDRRRTVCTRLEIVAPQYLEVDVTAAVQLDVGASADRVVAAVVEALERFLDPRTGGPAGRGWPFGRAVFRTEMLQVIAGVHGVDHILSLSLRGGAGEPQCGDLPVCPTWLVVPRTIAIDVPSVRARPRGRTDIPPCPSPSADGTNDARHTHAG